MDRFKLPYGIHVILDDTGKSGSISSDLHEQFSDPDTTEQSPEVQASVDALESFILALACEGYDLEQPSFVSAVETAISAIAHNL